MDKYRVLECPKHVEGYYYKVQICIDGEHWFFAEEYDCRNEAIPATFSTIDKAKEYITRHKRMRGGDKIVHEE